MEINLSSCQEADIRVPATLVDLDVTSETPAAPAAEAVRGSSRSSCDTRAAPLPRNSILQRLLTLQRHAEIGDHDAKELSDRLMNEIEASGGRTWQVYGGLYTVCRSLVHLGLLMRHQFRKCLWV